MIVAVRDLGNSGRVVNEVTAAIAGYASYSGLNTVVLQFSEDSDYTVDKLLYEETSPEDSYFAEKGIDALLTETSMGNISKETFYDIVRAFTKNRRLDVAEVSAHENFRSLLADRQMEVEALLSSAKSAYDIVLIPFGKDSEKEIFGIYSEAVMEQIDLVIWTVRQGAECKAHDHYPNEQYILTGYREDSKYTCKAMAKRIDAGKAQILPLSFSGQFRDALDDKKLVVFIRKAKASENDPVSDMIEFTTQMKNIVGGFGKMSKAKENDVWNLVEFDGALEDDFPKRPRNEDEVEEY